MAEMGDRAGYRVGDLVEEAPVLQVGLAFEVGHGEDRGETDAPSLALVPEVFDRVLLGPLLDVQAEQILVVVPVGVGVEDAKIHPFGMPHEGDEAFPLVLFDGDQEDQTIGTTEDPPWVQ